MVHKTDLIALKAQLHNDYHNLNTAIQNAIHNKGSVSDLEALYENLVESGFEAVSQVKKFNQENIDFITRVERRTKARQAKTPILYPYIDRTQLKAQPYEN